MPDLGERIFRRFARLFGAMCFVYAALSAAQKTLHDLSPDRFPDAGGLDKFLIFLALGYCLTLLARIDEKLDRLKADRQG
ncbi:hypothetical protein [Caulobacter endophyticus]|uniref:hypothetical protein n=1 Tax=Caulobacter endophyticus TaxID=2172652 RepID=UPI0024106DFF|nr:hypothetical protein [Caulobacter endophyticus]MDG2527690.1 hypothetical protein [Caulobacter endophyticus]